MEIYLPSVSNSASLLVMHCISPSHLPTQSFHSKYWLFLSRFVILIDICAFNIKVFTSVCFSQVDWSKSHAYCVHKLLLSKTNESWKPLHGFAVCQYEVTDAASAFSKTVRWHPFKETQQKCISFTSWWPLWSPQFLGITITHSLLTLSLWQTQSKESKKFNSLYWVQLKKIAFIWQNFLPAQWDYICLIWLFWYFSIS